MNLSHHAPTSLSDDTWIKEYIHKMGEKSFWGYKRQVYDLLQSLAIGEMVNVEKWVKPENIDIFIKIACCFISESKCCYQMNPEHTIIKRNFDAREMEKTLALLDRKRREKAAERNGTDTGSETGGIEAIPASEPKVQHQQG